MRSFSGCASSMWLVTVPSNQLWKILNFLFSAQTNLRLCLPIDGRFNIRNFSKIWAAFCTKSNFARIVLSANTDARRLCLTDALRLVVFAKKAFADSYNIRMRSMLVNSASHLLVHAARIPVELIQVYSAVLSCQYVSWHTWSSGGYQSQQIPAHSRKI